MHAYRKLTLIQTCRLCDANPFDYLTALQQNAAQAATHPKSWMPWNYQQAHDTAATPAP